MGIIEPKDFDALKEVGKVSSEAIMHAASMVKPGVKLMEVAESAESFMKGKGYGCAFPINISINEQAAHYHPGVGDEKAFAKDDLVKIDFGAAMEGMLGDGAITVDLSGRMGSIARCAEKALDSALGEVRHGVSVCEIGKAISDTITNEGFVPIRNLGGHGVGLHDLHADIFIPNYDNGDFSVLEEGMVVAIEPFVTTGRGMVVDSDTCEIFSYSEDMPVRSADARKLLGHIRETNPSEPFAARWLSSVLPSRFSLYAALSELTKAGALEQHPALVEVSGAPVTQAEAQVIVTKEGYDVVTRAKG